MAVGEYISVSSQKDAEQADIEKERREQEKGPAARKHELQELAQVRFATSPCSLLLAFTAAAQHMTIHA